MADTALERAEQLAERVLPARTPKRRMLVIVNPYATTVSDRLKNLVVYALEGRYSVEAVDTQARQHATELCREAAAEGYDVVVAFGGDGTVNEAANGLVGSDTPLTALPGGATNVFCRTLGIPADVVDATEHLLRMADKFEPRRVDLGLVSGRHFVFASGIGLDASVTERVDRHPYRKARFGEYYFTYSAFAAFNRKYLVKPPRLRIEADGRELEGVTVVVQNSDPFTYFSNHPIRLCRDAGFDTGALALAVLKRSTPFQMATLLPGVFGGDPDRLARHRHVDSLGRVESARVTALDERFPLQVDGDYVGEFEDVTYGVSPRALAVVS